MSDPSNYLSTLEAAQALGVSVSTIKRWVDEGVLPAHKTAGGHRKLLRAEVLVLARQGEVPRGDLGVLTGVSAKNKEATAETIAATLLDALERGDGNEATAIVRQAYSSGMAIEVLADEAIGPVMAKIGQDWVCANIDIWHEHRATALCSAALYDLKDKLEARAERNRPLALTGAPDGELHGLPAIVSQLVLMDAGWEVVQLGQNTPLISMAKAVLALQPRLVCLSVSYLKDPDAFIAGMRELYGVAEKQGVAVAIGGQGLTDSIRSSIPYTTHGDRMAHLAAFARTLHPRPKTPRRGRPAKS